MTQDRATCQVAPASEAGIRRLQIECLPWKVSARALKNSWCEDLRLPGNQTPEVWTGDALHHTASYLDHLLQAVHVNFNRLKWPIYRLYVHGKP